MKHIFLTLILVLFIQQPSTAQQLSSKNARSLKVLLSKLDKGKKTLEKKYSQRFAELNVERAKELEDIKKPIIVGLKALQKRVATKDLNQALKIRNLITEISTGAKPVVEVEVQKEQVTKLKQTGSPFVYTHTVDSKSKTRKLVLFLPDGTFIGPKRSGKWQRDGDKFTMSWDVPEKWVDIGAIRMDGFINGKSKGGENVDWHLKFSSQDSPVGGIEKPICMNSKTIATTKS